MNKYFWDGTQNISDEFFIRSGDATEQYHLRQVVFMNSVRKTAESHRGKNDTGGKGASDKKTGGKTEMSDKVLQLCGLCVKIWSGRNSIFRPQGTRAHARVFQKRLKLIKSENLAGFVNPSGAKV